MEKMMTDKSTEKKMKTESSMVGPRRHRQAKVPPLDMVADILSRLPVKLLLRFRCVCKQWCSLTSDPDFVRYHHKRARDRPALFSLFSTRNEVSLHYFGDDGETNSSSSFHCKFREPEKYRALSNCVNGLVCVSCVEYADDECCYLLNLSTREVAELPISARYAKLGLGFDASTGEYKVARIRTGKTYECYVLTVGTREWRYAGDAPPCMVLSSWPVFLNGALHWIVESNAKCKKGNPVPLDILVFDLEGEKIRMMPSPESWNRDFIRCIDLVVASGGGGQQLCFVCRPEPRYRDPGNFLIIWMLRDHTTGGGGGGHEWVKEYSFVDISRFTTIFRQCSIIAIWGDKIIFRAYCCSISGQAHLTEVYSFNLRRGTARVLRRGEMEHYQLFTESLVSPKNLVGIK